MKHGVTSHVIKGCWMFFYSIKNSFQLQQVLWLMSRGSSPEHPINLWLDLDLEIKQAWLQMNVCPVKPILEMRCSRVVCWLGCLALILVSLRQNETVFKTLAQHYAMHSIHLLSFEQFLISFSNVQYEYKHFLLEWKLLAYLVSVFHTSTFQLLQDCKALSSDISCLLTLNILLLTQKKQRTQQ